MHCDLAVVGGGNAGLVAAFEAKNRGANVLIFEKRPGRYGEATAGMRRIRGYSLK